MAQVVDQLRKLKERLDASDPWSESDTTPWASMMHFIADFFAAK